MTSTGGRFLPLILLALAALGGVAWLLLEDPEDAPAGPALEASNQETTAAIEAAPDESDSGGNRPITTRALVTAPETPVAWFEALAVALRDDDPAESEALRYGIRALLRGEDLKVVDLMGQISDPRARSEVTTLWIDARGLPQAERLTRWVEASDRLGRSALYARLARFGPAGLERLAALVGGEKDERVWARALQIALQSDRGEVRQQALRVAPSPELLVARALRLAEMRPDDPAVQRLLRRLFEEDVGFEKRELLAAAIAKSYPEADRARPGDQADFYARTGSEDAIRRYLAFQQAGAFMDAFKASNARPEDIVRVRERMQNAIRYDADPLARRAAILSRVGLHENITSLTAQCQALLDIAGEDADGGVRAAVLYRVHRGCAHTRTPLAPDYLEPYLRYDLDVRVRREALRTLPRYGRIPAHVGRARELLTWTLNNDPSPALRYEAAIRLTELGYAQARPHLMKAARLDPSQQVRDGIYAAARDQLSEIDPDLVRSLAQLDPDRAGDLEGLAKPGSTAASRGPVSLEFSLPSWAAPKLIADDEDDPVALYPEEWLRSPDEVSDDSEAEGPKHRIAPVWFTPEGTDLRLRGRLHYRFEGGRPLVVHLRSNPLLAGTQPLIGKGALARLCRRYGFDYLEFAYRGRGISEGASAGHEGDRADAAAAVAWALKGDAGAPRPAGFATPESLLVVAEGRGADLFGPPEEERIRLLRLIGGRNAAIGPEADPERALKRGRLRVRKVEARARLARWLADARRDEATSKAPR